MTNSNGRKRLAVWRNRFYLYPPADAMPHTRYFWLATGLVALLALLFAGYFSFYLTGRHAAYITSAEDLGIMDQAIWSTLHGQLFHQTICNTINDTNCSSIQGISRFAIHFEPILFLVSLFYLVCANPKTLLDFAMNSQPSSSRSSISSIQRSSKRQSLIFMLSPSLPPSCSLHSISCILAVLSGFLFLLSSLWPVKKRSPWLF